MTDQYPQYVIIMIIMIVTSRTCSVSIIWIPFTRFRSSAVSMPASASVSLLDLEVEDGDGEDSDGVLCRVLTTLASWNTAPTRLPEGWSCSRLLTELTLSSVDSVDTSLTLSSGAGPRCDRVTRECEAHGWLSYSTNEA